VIKIKIRIPDQGEHIVTIDGDQAVIGRNPDCDIQVPLRYVSGVHARVMAGVIVCDAGSTNGVWIDGQKIVQPTPLPGTTFRLGSQPDTSPELEVLETSIGGGGDEVLTRHLQEENEGLRQRVQELESLLGGTSEEGGSGTLAFPATPDPAPPPVSEPIPGPTEEEIPQPEQGAPFANFANFFNQSPEPGKAPTPPSTPPLRDTAPIPSPVPRPAPKPVDPVTERNRARVLEMIDQLISEDVGDRLPIIQGSVEEFFTLESFRLLRQVEKVVTRIARDFKELYDMKTMLPDADGNFRTLAAEVLTDPSNREVRQRLVNYLDELRRWLGVSLAANRKAAVRFAEEVKRDLTVEGLTEDRPIPTAVKLLGQEGAEYWKRTREYLRGLDGDRTEERLDNYAREFASEKMDRAKGGIEDLYR
jgi:pSer/pThr/pTyr-binding forkhead associated (FHA) protein